MQVKWVWLPGDLVLGIVRLLEPVIQKAEAWRIPMPRKRKILAVRASLALALFFWLWLSV